MTSTEWIISTILAFGGLFGVSKLIELYAVRRLAGSDKTIEVRIANEGKAIDASSAFVKDLLKRLADLEAEQKIINAKLLEQSVNNARLESENNHLQSENKNLQNQIGLLNEERKNTFLKLSHIEADYRKLREKLDGLEK